MIHISRDPVYNIESRPAPALLVIFSNLTKLLFIAPLRFTSTITFTITINTTINSSITNNKDNKNNTNPVIKILKRQVSRQLP